MRVSPLRAALPLTYRGVFAQLAQGGEGLLMGLPNPLDHLLRIRT